MDTEQLIDLVRREHRVALDPTDPVLAVATITRAMTDEAKAEIRKMLDETGAQAERLHRASEDIIALSKGRLLSPDGEQQAARIIAGAARQEMASVARSIKFGTWLGSVALAMALLGVGFAGGYAWQESKVAAFSDTMSGLQTGAARDGPAAAAQWRALVAYNHVHDMLGKDCKVTVVNGRRKCETSVWIDPEPATR
jgi:hypothetical protein